MRRFWAVFEDVAQMGFALAAHHLYSLHTECTIFFGLYVIFRDGRPKTRPSRAGFEFCIRAEEFIAAADAPVYAFIFQIVVLTRESSLRSFLPRDMVLLLCELFAALFVTGAPDREVAGRCAGRDRRIEADLEALRFAEFSQRLHHPLHEIALDTAIEGLIVVLVRTPENVKTDLTLVVYFRILE